MAHRLSGFPGGKGGKGGKGMAERGFAELLAAHLDTGTRPGLKPGAVGGVWTAAAFGIAANVSDRTVRNWRSASTLPDSDALTFILDALFGDDPRLRTDRLALQEAWDAAQRQRLATIPQQTAGLRFRLEDDHFAADATPEPTDAAAAEDVEVQRQHAVARQMVGKLLLLVRRRHNALTQVWDDLLPSVESLAERLDEPTAALPADMAWLYQDALSVGSLLEQHTQLIAHPEAGEQPLPVDLRRVLADAVGATALLVRAFPSNRERDAQFGMFWDRDAVTAARAVKAMAADVLRAPDAELLDAMDRTAERQGVQGDKAKGSLIASIGNLALAATASLMLSGIANESPFIKRVSAFVVRMEEPVGRLLGSLPADVGAAIRFGMELAKDLPDAVPPNPARRDPPPDFDMDEVKRMVLAGEAPPAAWVPFIRELDFTGEPLADLTALSGLIGLQSLDLDGTQVADVTPLSGLTGLQSLYLNRTQVSDVTPLSGLTALQLLMLLSTPVTDLMPLSGLTGLQTLVLMKTQVVDVTPLSGLTGLQKLDLDGTQVVDVTPLSGLTGLQSLDLRGTQVVDVTPLSGLTGLQSLDLRGTPVVDVTPLSGLTSLQELYLDGRQVMDVTPLSGLTGLTVHRDGRSFKPSEGNGAPPRGAARVSGGSGGRSPPKRRPR